MPTDNEAQLLCKQKGCTEERVSGRLYCEDHELEHQVKAVQVPAATGTLADMIRNAKKKGLIAPVANGYAHQP